MATVEQLATAIAERFPEIISSKIALGELTIEVNASNLIDVCLALCNEPLFQFNQLMDVCGVDYLTYGISEWATTTATSEGFSRGTVAANRQVRTDQMPERFAVVYHLLSNTQNHRIRIRTFAHDEPPRVPSVINIWQSADWYEREIFDLFGIIAEGHPDLRRILTDYGFIGHPFRKDFPLIGQVEMRYDATAGRVVYEPVSIQPRTLVPKVIRFVGHDLKT